MRGAEILVKNLERYGVRYIFGLPGDATPFFRALKGSSIKFITVRDERGAGFAADVYGRLTGKPGIVYVSRGPGGANALSGIASSFLDASPTIFIIDQVSRKYNFPRTHMNVEFEKVFAPVSKGAELIWHVKDIPDAISRAWSDTQAHPKGPRCLVVPQDIFDEEAPYQYKPPPYRETKDDSKKAAAAFIETVRKKKCPIAVLGPGVVEHSGSKEFRKFIKNFPIPYFTTRYAKGTIAENHPLNFGIMFGKSAAFPNTDLVITIGLDVTEKPGHYQWINKNSIQHLNISHFSHPKLFWFSPSKSFTADLKNFFRYAVRNAPRDWAISPPPYKTEDWRRKIATDTHKDLGGTLLVKLFGKEHLGGILSRNDILISDTGIHKTLILYTYEAPGPNTLFSIGFSAIGFALPGTIGASLAKPNARVVAVCGDGGFLMSIAELETIHRLKLPIKIIVVADNSYGLIKQRQYKAFGDKIGVDFTNPDFRYIARAFGFQYVPVRREKDLKKAHSAILLRKQPSLIVLYEKYKYGSK